MGRVHPLDGGAYRYGANRPPGDSDVHFESLVACSLFAPGPAVRPTLEGGIRLAGPGALARTLPGEMLRKLLLGEHREQFLDQCYRYDSQPWVCGMGMDNLVAAGRKDDKGVPLC